MTDVWLTINFFLILQDIISPQLYAHFMMLSKAINILLVKNDNVNIEYAGLLLQTFHKALAELYAESFYSFNMHALVHLKDQVKAKGPLSENSNFGFESAMGKLLRPFKNNASLHQVVEKFVCRSVKMYVICVSSGVFFKYS
jgi:hypothetical protein